ncbi:cell division protein ZapE [Xinfangfangia sp. D13-10-4-6]|uniref:cell division protein ZapE n=1 Tax=Pseudogemmobacter hezensis TaxID=2737662 RepID=UPI001556F437|nr:cell division protein ZapE [Pseudogemmobacter hezensis]NPD14052.1 cell division protein ZapE [Pseudogemmobacter hezensis]
MRQTLSEIYETRVSEGLLRPDPAQKAVLPLLEELRLWLETTPARKGGFLSGLFGKAPVQGPKGLYLWGGVGRGKSMMMDLFTEATAIPEKRRVHFHAFMQEIHHGMHEARQKGVEDPLAPVAAKITKELRLLAFDEMQITDITDAMIVGRLFEKLFAAGVVIVTTSNRPPEDLYKNGLNRQLFLPFIAMLGEKMTVHEIVSANDYRQHRLKGAQVWFQPAGSSRGQIDAIWKDLTGGAAGAPLRLPVNGREVELPRFANGVGRASFYDLCARPLGAADFLAIAAACRVLILDDIPQLSASNYNEAKRFVTLVDALYEAKVRLIASAADEPERLYNEGTGAFEFERTASRLREMQDAAWGTEEPGEEHSETQA